MKKNIVLLTGAELRHEFFRKFISSHEDISVLVSFCEFSSQNLSDTVIEAKQPKDLRSIHLSTRGIVEKDFFELFCNKIEDKSNPIFIKKGDINNQEQVNKITELNPEIIISYGCSIIKPELINKFRGKFINIHLGLSPYYRGSATNFWPFVNNELQFIGTTFMHIDEGVDTGEIIHQIRASILHDDNIHQIGNRLIRDSCIECVKLVRSINKIDKVSNEGINPIVRRYYKKKDFTEESLIRAYENLSNGAINNFLKNQNEIESIFPIIKNPCI